MFSFFAPDFVLDVRIFVQGHPDLKHVLWSRWADQNQIFMCREKKTLWSRDINDRQVNGRHTPQRILPVDS